MDNRASQRHSLQIDSFGHDAGDGIGFEITDSVRQAPADGIPVKQLVCGLVEEGRQRLRWRQGRHAPRCAHRSSRRAQTAPETAGTKVSPGSAFARGG